MPAVPGRPGPGDRSRPRSPHCTLRRGITQEDYSLTGALLAASTFAFWISVLSDLSWRSKRLGRILDGVPLVIVQDGVPIDRALTVERLPLAEVLEAARQNGIDTLDKVRLAILAERADLVHPARRLTPSRLVGPAGHVL